MTNSQTGHAAAALLAALLLSTGTILAVSFTGPHAVPVPDPGDPPAAGGGAPQDREDGNVLPAGHLPAARCRICHSNSPRAAALRDAQDRPIAPYDLWQSSMMANSARDPFWRAVVSAEIAATPSRKAAIEEKCTRCHTPTIRPVGESPAGRVLAAIDGHGETARLGRDGVNCTVCHRITPEGLGEARSFTGGFKLSKEPLIFGPHSAPLGMPMTRHTNFTPTFGGQIEQSALCGSCHTLITETLDAEGNKTGHRHHEQSPYLEWRNSVFSDESAFVDSDARSCQDCHLPTADQDGNEIEARIARNPGGRDFPFVAPRSPYGRHLLVGGNTLIPRMLRDEPSLGALAPTEAFDATIAAARRQLRTRTARIEIGAVAREDDQVIVPVTLENLTGHKLPTGYPSRRMWLRLQVVDRAGTTVFVSGRWDEDGRLLDGEGKPLACEAVGAAVEPHHRVIERPDQVQIYEGVMAGVDGRPTMTLLRAAGHAKDNRLLPRGWSPDGPHAKETAPVGVQGDDDFRDGADTVQYRLRLPPAAGPYRLTVSALYLVISARHVNELFTVDTPEVRAFKRLYEKTPHGPELLAVATKTF